LTKYYDILLQIGLYSHQLPVIIVAYNLIKYRRVPITDKLLYFFIIYNGIVILIEQFILLGRIDNFNPIFNIQSIIDTGLILLFLGLIVNKKAYFNLSFIITILFCILGILEITTWGSISAINTLSNSIGKFLVAISSVYAIYQLTSSITTPFNKGYIVLTLTFLFYTILSLIIALFEEIIRQNYNSFFEKIWMLQITLGLLFNVSISFGIWLMKK
jgi:hypothetical protein